MFSYPVFLLAGVFLYHFHVLSRLKECGASLWLSPLPHLTHLQLLMLAEPVLWGCFLLEISLRSWGGGGMEISLLYSRIPKSVLKATIIDSHLWPFSAGKCLCVSVLLFCLEFLLYLTFNPWRQGSILYVFSFTPNIYAIWKDGKSHFDSVIWWFTRNMKRIHLQCRKP